MPIRFRAKQRSASYDSKRPSDIYKYEWILADGKERVMIPKDVMEEHMKVCRKCKEREAVRRMVDFHVDWIDCFWDCPNDYEHWIKAKEGA